jgi:hypothetical protein
MTSWTSPRSWVNGETIGATIMNTHIRDNENAIWEQISGAGWTAFTPSWTNLTVGDGTNAGYYAMAGKTTILRVAFTFGSTSSVSGGIIMALPSTSVAYTAYTPLGWAHLLDSDASRLYQCAPTYNTTTSLVLYAYTVSGSAIFHAGTGTTSPFTWAVNDSIVFQAVYERA